MRLNTSPVCHKEPPYEYSTHVQTACVCSPHIRLLIGVLCNLSAGVCATMAFTCMNDEAEVYISCVCESVCVIPTRAVMASLIPRVIDSPVRHLLGADIERARAERPGSKLPWADSLPQDTHFPAGIADADRLPVVVSFSHALFLTITDEMHSVSSDVCYRPRDAALRECMDLMYSDTHICTPCPPTWS